MTERKNVTNGHKQKSLKSLVGTFQRLLSILLTRIFASIISLSAYISVG